MKEDPYASMIKECEITYSQEEELQKCRFALEPEEEELSPPFPVQSTGIIMLSLPESNENHQEEDVFHTPPEHHRSESMSSSEDQGPENPQVVQRKGTEDRDEEVLVDGGFKDTEMMVDLGKDSDTLGFSEPKFSKEIGGDDSVNTDIDLNTDETFRNDSKKIEVLESDCAQFVLDKCEVCIENFQFTSQNVYLGDTEQIVIVSENMEIGETEVVELASEDNCKEMRARVTENTEDVDERVLDANLGGHSSSKNIDDLDAFRYVSNGDFEKSGLRKGVSGRGGLCNSSKGPEEDEGLFAKDKKTSKDLLSAARMVFDDITDTDYLRTAKECGLSFYQPRWWPPEGLDDQIMD